MLNRLLAISIIIFPSLCTADEVRFTEKEVQANIVEYINKVFGAKPPTLADLIRYEKADGGLIEHESPFEYEVCRKKYKAPHPELGGCSDFLDYRHQHKNKAESLYYRALRKKLAVTADMLNIESIRFVAGIPDKSAGYFLATIGVVENPDRRQHSIHKQILLVHVDSPEQVPEAGTVSVGAVVIPNEEFVMPPRIGESSIK